MVNTLFIHRLEPPFWSFGGSKGVDVKNDSPSPHDIAETPSSKGFRHGESLPKGLPKGLPRRLPIGWILTRSKCLLFGMREGQDALWHGGTFGETFGETFSHGLPMQMPFAQGHFARLWGDGDK